MTKKLTDTLLAALVNEDRISIVSVVTEPGLGACHAVKQFAKREDLSIIDIRTESLTAMDFIKISADGETVEKNGYAPVRHILMSDEPVVILIDEVSHHTFDKTQRLINQISLQARAKVLVVLVSQRTDAARIPEDLAKAMDLPIIETGPIDVTHAFVEFLREQKNSDTHLKVADFVEEHGLSGASPHQWQLFALTHDMGLTTAAACGLANEDLAKRFVEWEPGQGKIAQ